MKTTIIAEACQNHKGDLKILGEMISAAKDSGADYIKIQSMLSKELTQREQFESGISENGKNKFIKRPYQNEYERLKPMDLDDEAHIWFVEECLRVGIKPLTTAFSFSRIPFLSSLAWDEIKVASYDCASYPFIKELMNHFSHLIISTGSSIDEEIQKTAALLAGHSFSFLHCVTIYPTPLDQIHLRRIDWLRQFTASVGLSDHTLVERDGLKASFAAIYYGANIIERHFTILDKTQTKDGPISVSPKDLKKLVEFTLWSRKDQGEYIAENVPEYENMLGQMNRSLSEQEVLNRDYYRGRFASRVGGRRRYNWEDPYE